MAIENEVVIIAEAVALPGKREELRRAFVEDFVPKSLAEEGVSVFRLHENRDNPGHFVLYDASAIRPPSTSFSPRSISRGSRRHLRRWRRGASRRSLISTS